MNPNDNYKTAIILGSSRSEGNTAHYAKLLQKEMEADLIDLNEYDYSGYDYDYRNQGDDFPALIEEISTKYKLIIFATPVYWYAMSGKMKLFFDRLSDIVRINKPVGRNLEGKYLAMLSCSSEGRQVEGFEMPFKLSAEYLNMHYLGYVHTWKSKEEFPKHLEQSIKAFSQNLKARCV